MAAPAALGLPYSATCAEERVHADPSGQETSRFSPRSTTRAAEIKDGVLLLRDNVIERVGTSPSLPAWLADRVLDLSGHIVMPAW